MKADPLVEPLTKRELEVLGLLAANQTNQEIARQLSLSLHSVKWFARQIYTKLGVTGRREAAVRAAELGLLVSAQRTSSSTDGFPSLPSGTVTFLFTDIVGSTPLWEKMPAAMEQSVAQHHAILRRAIEENDGQVFQVIGDAFQAAFRLAPDGLAAAISAQRGLAAAAWGATGPVTVRMGLHTGPAELDPLGNAPYAVSHTLNRTARIMSAGQGGQILLSKEAADLVERHLPEEVALKDLGEHQLKGMQLPERLFQIVVPDLPWIFPPIAASTVRRSNLPVQLTSFIGREKEIGEIKHLLESHRLMTLTGSGGTGKTRLSLRAAAQVLERYPDGVWLVELAPLVDGEKIPQLIATTLGLHDSRNRPPLDHLIDWLSDRRLLLVLDNCEHLIEACARLADRLLHECPQLSILASSREALGIAGETAYRVPSMPVPQPDQALLLDDLGQYESMRLFTERAAAVQPGFAITAANASAVAQICRRLDGIPLAIELAAARTSLLAVEQIAARLDDRFRLLTGGSRTALPRQQTLRASIDWSYSLLEEREKRLLMRLAVFAGGWTLEAAEAVCGFDGLADFDVLDGLDQLVRKSLVAADSRSGPEGRYRMLETVRQYAREKLFDQGEGEAVRNRHLNYYLALAERAEPHLRSFEQVAWNDRLEVEVDNLRSALVWSEAEEGEIEKGLRIAWSLRYFWHERGYTLRGEIVNWIERILTHHPLSENAAPEQVLVWANAMAVQAFTLTQLGKDDETINIRYEQGQRLYDQLGPPGWKGLAFLLFGWAAFIHFRGDHSRDIHIMRRSLQIAEALGDRFAIAEALPFANQTVDLTQSISYRERTLTLRRSIGDLEGIWFGLMNLAIYVGAKGDHQRALSLIEEANELARLVKNPYGQTWVGYNHGMLLVESGQFNEAIASFEQALAITRQTGEQYLAVVISTGLGSLLRKQGKKDAARVLLAKALSAAQKNGFRNEQGIILFSQGEMHWEDGELELAEQAYQEARTIWQNTQMHISGLGEFGLGKIALARGHRQAARSSFRKALETWLAQDINDHIPFLLDALAVMVALRASDKQLDATAAGQAARLHGAGQAYRYLSYLHFLIRPHFEPYDMEACLAPAREILGEAAYQRAFEAGQALTLEEAVALALEVTGEGGPLNSRRKDTDLHTRSRAARK